MRIIFPIVISLIIENYIFYKRKKGKVFAFLSCPFKIIDIFSLYDKQNKTATTKKNQQEATCKNDTIC